MRVLILGADAEAGGVFGYIGSVVRHADPNKFSFHIAVPRIPERMDGNINFYRFPATYNFVSLPFHAQRLCGFIKEHRIDVIHLHTARAGLLGALAALPANVPIVYTGHSWRYEQKSGVVAKNIFRLLEKFICSRSKRVTFLTQRDLDQGLSTNLLPAYKASFVRTRIGSEKQELACKSELRGQWNIPEGALVIGNTGELSERKDPATFLRAAQIIATKCPQAYFLLVGDGPQRVLCEKLALELGIAERVMITGRVASKCIPALLGCMDIFLFTSRIEGVPLSLLEAQASLVPIVSSNYAGSGVEEVVCDGVTGFTFAVGDFNAAAQLALRLLYADELRREIAANARRDFELNHSGPELMAREFERIYETVTDAAG